jgi:hypothetical protein
MCVAPEGNERPGLSVAEAYRGMRRQAQANLLAQIASLPSVTNYDTALQVIRMFREYLLTESMQGDGDWDPQLAQRLNAALAMALTAIAGAIEARDLEAALDFR